MSSNTHRHTHAHLHTRTHIHTLTQTADKFPSIEQMRAFCWDFNHRCCGIERVGARQMVAYAGGVRVFACECACVCACVCVCEEVLENRCLFYGGFQMLHLPDSYRWWHISCGETNRSILTLQTTHTHTCLVHMDECDSDQSCAPSVCTSNKTTQVRTLIVITATTSFLLESSSGERPSADVLSGCKQRLWEGLACSYTRFGFGHKQTDSMFFRAYLLI